MPGKSKSKPLIPRRQIKKLSFIPEYIKPEIIEEGKRALVMFNEERRR